MYIGHSNSFLLGLDRLSVCNDIMLEGIFEERRPMPAA